MELKVNRDELMNGVNISLKAIPNKTTVGILECIMITAENDEVRFTSSDMELGIETYIDAEISQDGSVCVDAKTLSAIVGKLADGMVTLKTDDTTMTIKCGKARFSIAVKDSSEFPAIESVKRENAIELSQNVLKDNIRQTVFCAAVSETNKMMNGCLFSIAGDKMKITALDGHRIAMREINLDKEYDPVKAIIPAKTLQEIAKLLSDGDVDLYITNNLIGFAFDRSMIVSRLIEGEFFDINKLIQNDFQTTMTVDRQEFCSCVDRAILLIKDIDRKPVIFTIGDTLKAEIATQLGSMSEEMEAITEGTKEWFLGLNPRFLLDVLRVLDEDKVTIYLNNPKTPCYINGEGYSYVILPVQVQA